MRVITRNDLDIVTRLFAERNIPATHAGVSTGGNEIFWDVPKEYEDAVRQMYCDEHVLFFSDNTTEETAWTALDTQVLDAVSNFVVACNKIEDETPAGDVSDIGDYFGDCMLPPRCLAQILMQNLTHLIDGRAMPLPQKRYWMTVADQMGPDWIEQFNRVGIFMQQVDKL